MELFVVRHGVALNVGETGIRRDAERTLSPAGRKKTGQVAKGLAALDCSPGRIGTSPLARAEETARILADELCPDAPFELCGFLEPGASSRDVADWMKRIEEDSAMIVGHMPDVAQIASELLCADGGLDMVFKKAAACCISFDGDPALGAGLPQTIH